MLPNRGSETNAITRLPDTTAATLQASLLAVTIEDICRVLFRHALTRCRDIFGTSSGRTDIAVDYDLWTVVITCDVDRSNVRSAPPRDDRDDSELRTISHLGLVHIVSSSSAGETVRVWQDGVLLRCPSGSGVGAFPSLSAEASSRGVTVCMRDVFSGMPVRRKLIASEATKKSRIAGLVNCARELSLLAPDSSIRLSVRHASAPEGPKPSSKVLLRLPKAEDLVHRYKSAFEAESDQLENVHIVAAEHTFSLVRMSINGFAASTAIADAPRFVFLQQRLWPGTTMHAASQESERECAVFGSLLSTFRLSWTEESANRCMRQTALSPELYEKVCQRIKYRPDSGAKEQAFVLDITLQGTGQEIQGRELTVTSFEAAVLDAICKGPPVEHGVSPGKRKGTSRPGTAGEGGVKELEDRLVRARPASASLATESYGSTSAAPEGMVEWRNPVNGRLFHIDQRTGNSVAVGPGAQMESGDGMSISERSRKTFGGIVVDRSRLSKGLDLSIPKLSAALDETGSVGEFDDPGLDEALASIPSPSAVTAPDTLRKSRFFDSRLLTSPLKQGHFTSVDEDGSDAQGAVSQRNSLELAITRSDLQTCRVLDQVDGKFILCITSSSSNPVLFCIDQHAADERYRLERLLEQYVADCAAGTAAHALRSTLTLGISMKQYELLQGRTAVREGLKTLGWSIKDLVLVHATLGHAQVDLEGIPYILKEKALTDRGRVKDEALLQASFANCLEEVTPFRGADWLTASRGLPSALIDLVKSTACRSAIMFNDRLSREACERVVERLGRCRFPFGCAHGRPSLVPLCGVGTMQKGPDHHE